SGPSAPRAGAARSDHLPRHRAQHSIRRVADSRSRPAPVPWAHPAPRSVSAPGSTFGQRARLHVRSAHPTPCSVITPSSTVGLHTRLHAPSPRSRRAEAAYPWIGQAASGVSWLVPAGAGTSGRARATAGLTALDLVVLLARRFQVFQRVGFRLEVPLRPGLEVRICGLGHLVGRLLQLWVAGARRLLGRRLLRLI